LEIIGWDCQNDMNTYKYSVFGQTEEDLNITAGGTYNYYRGRIC